MTNDVPQSSRCHPALLHSPSSLSPPLHRRATHYRSTAPPPLCPSPPSPTPPPAKPPLSQGRHRTPVVEDAAIGAPPLLLPCAPASPCSLFPLLLCATASNAAIKLGSLCPCSLLPPLTLSLSFFSLLSRCSRLTMEKGSRHAIHRRDKPAMSLEPLRACHLPSWDPHGSAPSPLSFLRRPSAHGPRGEASSPQHSCELGPWNSTTGQAPQHWPTCQYKLGEMLGVHGKCTHECKCKFFNYRKFPKTY
jgi:hypothetical protein